MSVTVSTQNASERYQLEVDPPKLRQPQWLIACGRAIAALSSLWERPLLNSRKIQVTLWVILLAICGARAFLGLVGTEVFSHDPTLSLDGAWRMLNGQRPHTDFFSNLGVLMYLPTVVGLLLSHGTAQGFGYGQALTALGLGVWCYALCRSRLLDISTLLLSLLAVSMAAAPFSLGFSPLKISGAMVYNRVGYVILALILIEATNASRKRTAGHELMGGVSTGAALALLFFLKITYSVGAAVLIVALVGMRVQKKPRWVGLLLGSAGVLLIACVYFHFNLLPMLHNLHTVAQVRQMLVGLYMLDDIFEHAGALLAFGFASVVFLGATERWKAASRVGLVTLVTGALGCVIIFANYEQSGFPLAGFVAVVILDQVARETYLFTAPRTDVVLSPYRGLQGVALLLGGVMILVPLSATAMSLGRGLYWKVAQAPMARTFHSAAMAGFVPAETWYTDFINDGLALLKANQRPGETVMSLDFSNPFPFATQSKPAEGGATVLQYLSTFNLKHMPVPEWLFGKADLVMVPKYYSDDSLPKTIPALYGPYLARHFSRVAESPQWELWRHRPDAKR